MINRHIRAFGVPPWVGYLAVLVAFIGFSLYAFLKTEWAVYIYVILGLSWVAKLSEKRRNDFLKTGFRRKEYHSIRILENAIISLPFCLFLGYEREFWAIGVLLFMAFFLALINYQWTLSKTIPTPFSRRPFEFPVGFRKTFYGFGLAYSLTFIAIWVGNFNLGAFAMMLVFFITLTYYSEPEQEFYVWIHSMSATQFMMYKLKTFFIYSTILIVPIVMALGVAFSESIWILAVLALLGYIYVSLIILAKYGAYPSKINIPDGFLIGLNIVFPPLLLLAIPFFWRKSQRRLKTYLHD